jgi:hypothetical protein
LHLFTIFQRQYFEYSDVQRRREIFRVPSAGIALAGDCEGAAVTGKQPELFLLPA